MLHAGSKRVGIVIFPVPIQTLPAYLICGQLLILLYMLWNDLCIVSLNSMRLLCPARLPEADRGEEQSDGEEWS